VAFDLRVEYLREEHIDSYVALSRAEYGEHAAVSQPDHLRWKFLQNPQGRTMGVHLYRDSELVGRMVALARKFVYRGQVYTAAHIVDFLVHPSARGMPALMQLVIGLKQLSGFDLLLIMAPNPAGAAVWEKFVKMPGYFDLDTAVVPLQPAAVLQATGKLRTGAFGKLLDFPARFLAGGGAWLGAAMSCARVETEWPSANELDQLVSRDWGDRVVGYRSAEFLRWRYSYGPIFRYHVLFLREGGELKGYLVTRRTVHDGLDCLFLVDAFGVPELASGSWRGATMRELARASFGGAELVMLLGNTSWGPLSEVGAFPFVRVPPRLLPRKTTVYAQWVTKPGFEISRDNFYCALGDSDVI